MCVRCRIIARNVLLWVWWCVFLFFFFFFKQKTAYEIGTGDWSSDVCSSDLVNGGEGDAFATEGEWVYGVWIGGDGAFLDELNESAYVAEGGFVGFCSRFVGEV